MLIMRNLNLNSIQSWTYLYTVEVTVKRNTTLIILGGMLRTCEFEHMPGDLEWTSIPSCIVYLF